MALSIQVMRLLEYPEFSRQLIISIRFQCFSHHTMFAVTLLDTNHNCYQGKVRTEDSSLEKQKSYKKCFLQVKLATVPQARAGEDSEARVGIEILASNCASQNRKCDEFEVEISLNTSGGESWVDSCMHQSLANTWSKFRVVISLERLGERLVKRVTQSAVSLPGLVVESNQYSKMKVHIEKHFRERKASRGDICRYQDMQEWWTDLTATSVIKVNLSRLLWLSKSLLAENCNPNEILLMNGAVSSYPSCNLFLITDARRLWSHLKVIRMKRIHQNRSDDPQKLNSFLGCALSNWPVQRRNSEPSKKVTAKHACEWGSSDEPHWLIAQFPWSVFLHLLPRIDKETIILAVLERDRTWYH